MNNISKIALFILYFFFLSNAVQASQLGLKNVNTATFLLTGIVADPQSYCGSQGRSDCFKMIGKDAQQWVTVSNWIQVDYDVCNGIKYDQTGKPSCADYLGHVGVNFTPASTTLKGVSGGTATLSPYQTGQPFSVSFKPSTSYQYPTTPSTYSKITYRGVNLAGAEYDYATNLPSLQDGAYYAAKGMNTIRLPFKWEYLQSASTNPRDKTNDPNVPINFNNPNAKAYLDLVNSYLSKGMIVIIDMHNYMRYGSENKIIGSGEAGAPTAKQYANAWGLIATQFKNNDRVIFDLMNEPYSMRTETILDNYNMAIQAIRDTGAKNLILLEGNNWSGAHSWTDSSYGVANSIVFVPNAIHDPMNNYAINVHQYFDANYSGTTDCVPNKIPSLDKFHAYLQQHKLRVIVTELGGLNTKVCATDVNNFLQAINTYPYTPESGGYIGWTGWAGGSKALDLSTYFGPRADGSQTVTMTDGFQLHLTVPITTNK